MHLILILTILQGWSSRQVDFVMAYAQADTEFDMYMCLSKGVEVVDSTGPQVLKLLKNLHGSKQAGK
eukprot:13175707-Ditylum_brightwellii.AAC.1